MLANKTNITAQGPVTGRAHAKTPAAGKLNPKTPFRVPLNDENAGTAHPKTAKNLFAGKDASQFVTPAPGNRRALAGKTTNAKARKPSSEEKQEKPLKSAKPRKIEIIEDTQPAVQVAQEAESIPEPEYAPPPPKDLPDFDEPAINYEFLKNNLMRDAHRHYLSDYDEDGKSQMTRIMEANFRRAEEETEAERLQLLSDLKGIHKKPEEKPKKMAAPRPTALNKAKRHQAETTAAKRTKPRPTSRPTTPASLTRPASRGASTLNSKRAAQALAQRPASSASTARPTSAKAHNRSFSTKEPVKKSWYSNAPDPAARETAASRSRSRSPTDSSAAARAAATSKTTIGYTAGRHVQDEISTGPPPYTESAIEAIRRIQREDDEKYGKFEDMKLPPIVLEGDEEGGVLSEDEDVILAMPDPVLEEAANFVIDMPEF